MLHALLIVYCSVAPFIFMGLYACVIGFYNTLLDNMFIAAIWPLILAAIFVGCLYDIIFS